MTINTTNNQQRLLVLPPNLPANTTLRSLTLPHPRTAAPTTYLFYTADRTVDPSNKIHLLSLDLVSNPQSAFINNSVHQSGSYLLATPFDLTFLLLHLLAARSTENCNACMVDDLLHSTTFPDLAVLAHTYPVHLEQLLAAHLCTAVPITADQSAFRLDSAKVTQWLAAKVKSLAAALERRGASSVYPPLPSPQIVGDDEFKWTRYAMTLVSEWLVEDCAPEWMRAVAESLGVPKVEVTQTGVMDQLVAASVAGLGGKVVDDDEGASSKKKAKTSTSKKPVNKAAGIKVPKGQKSVAAFFTKKS